MKQYKENEATKVTENSSVSDAFVEAIEVCERIERGN